MKKKYFAITSYMIAGLFIFMYLISETIPNFHLSEIGRLFLLCGSCLFLYFGGRLLSQIKSANKPMKVNLWLFFTLYIILLVTLTLFDSMWGRNGLTFINWFSDEFIYYVKHAINLTPFKTIMCFVREFNSMYSSRVIILNLFGNFVALMPMAFFLPLLFKRQNKFKNFFITISLIVFGIELLQLLTASGRFDIDDFILNIAGATLIYFILKIKDVNRLIKNIFLLEKNKIPKKSLIIIIISVLLVILGSIWLVRFRNKLYIDNYNEYNRVHNPDFTITYEASDDCEEELDLFYEDELYNYYFTCMKSNKVYVDVKDDKKYLIADFLKNTTYNFDIDRMLDVLDSYKIKYIKDNKYEYITLKVKVPSNSYGGYSSPSIDIDNSNGVVVDTKYDFEDDFKTATFYYRLHLIPKEAGDTTISILFKDGDNLLATYKYLVKVDDEFNVVFDEID